MMILLALAVKVVVAIVLAVVAELLTRRARRRYLGYAIWLSILLFLLIPPTITVYLFDGEQKAIGQTVTATVPIAEYAMNEVEPGHLFADRVSSDSPLSLPNGESQVVTEHAAELDREQNAAVSDSSLERTGQSNDTLSATASLWPAVAQPAFWVLLAAWVLGGLVLLIRRLQALNSISRLLAVAEPASPEMQQRYKQIASEIGVQSAPELVIANGKFSPMLWHSVLKKSRIILPSEVLETLSNAAVDLIYRHELIHFKRKDGLRRWVELLATIVWWWFPIAFLAQRRLRYLEETLTDAETVQSNPSSARIYARTLLDMEEFVSSGSATGMQLVPTFNGEHPLKSRVEAIVNGTLPRQTRTGRAIQMLVVTLVLPLGILTAGTSSSDEPLETNGMASLPLHNDLKVAWKAEISSPSFGGAAVADIDDDGRLEIAFGTYFGDNSVRVLNSEDGSEYWRYDAGHACLDASLRFADLDKNGALELVVPISNKGSVLSFDAKSGDELWNYSTSPKECTDSPPAIVDFDNDGQLEVVYGTFHGKMHVLSGQGKRKQLFHPAEDAIQTGPLAIDVNSDKTLDLICGTFKGDNTLYAVDGKNGKTLWQFKVPGEHIGMYHGPSVGDINQDGNLDLVFGAYNGRVYCLNASNGNKQWEFDSKDSYIMSPTVLADLDGDGNSEVVVSSEFTTVLDCDGNQLWSKRCAEPNDAATRGASIADLSGDGKLDIASLSGRGLFQAFDGMTGKLVYRFDAAETTDKPLTFSSHGVAIADFTGDSKLDVFFVVGATRPQKHGLAICLTGFEGSGQGWYMLRHDVQNTGNLATKLDEQLLARIENPDFNKNPIMRPARKPRIKKVAATNNNTRQLPPQSQHKLFEMAKERKIPQSIVEEALKFPADFAKHGEQGFCAVCLLIETGNHKGTYCHPLLEATWYEEGEKELLELAKRENLPNYGTWSALSCLGYSDSPEIRQ